MAATAIIGGLGSYMARTAFLGSINAKVQDPAQRRDTMLYGAQVILDGNMWKVNEAVVTDGTDIVLTAAWQRVPGCAVLLTKSIDEGDMRVITETQLWETGDATAAVEVSISDSNTVPPAGPSWEFSALEANSNESYPATCICATAWSAGATAYLWIRVTGGQVTLRGTYIPATPEGAKQRTTKMGIIVPFKADANGLVLGNAITGP